MWAISTAVDSERQHLVPSLAKYKCQFCAYHEDKDMPQDQDSLNHTYLEIFAGVWFIL